MNKLFNKIISVGFDLDQTLYPKNYEIDNLVIKGIARKILERKPELGNVNKVICFYEKEYKKVGSRTQVLKNMGYVDAQEIIQFSLENPHILKLLKKDIKLVNLLEKIKTNIKLF